MDTSVALIGRAQESEVQTAFIPIAFVFRYLHWNLSCASGVPQCGFRLLLFPAPAFLLRRP